MRVSMGVEDLSASSGVLVRGHCTCSGVVGFLVWTFERADELGKETRWLLPVGRWGCCVVSEQYGDGVTRGWVGV